MIGLRTSRIAQPQECSSSTGSMTAARIAREKVIATGWGLLFTGVLALLIGVGSRNLAHFFVMSPSDLAPPYWFNMGAVAISTLAGAALAAAAPHSAILRELLPFVKGQQLIGPLPASATAATTNSRCRSPSSTVRLCCRRKTLPYAPNRVG